MAEASHGTETVAGLPSLFELIAADGLSAALLPAVRHFSRVIVSWNPRWKFVLETHLDELFLLINTVVQNHYLRTYAGSLAEHFYGLKRVADDGAARNLGIKLSPLDVYRSLVWLCAFPYIRNKLEQLFEEIQHDHASGVQPEERWRRYLHLVLLRVYPLLHSLFCLSVAGHYLCYVLELSRHHSPLTRLAGVQLGTVTEADRASIQHRDAKLSNWALLRQRGLLTAVSLFSLHAASRALGGALEMGSFFVQFLESWSGSEERTARRLGQAEVAPPTERHRPQVAAAEVGLCPLCGKRRTSEAVLSVSGHVFCHVCLFRYVSEKGRCPVTWYPATTDQIYRLYPPDG